MTFTCWISVFGAAPLSLWFLLEGWGVGGLWLIFDVKWVPGASVCIWVSNARPSRPQPYSRPTLEGSNSLKKLGVSGWSCLIQKMEFDSGSGPPALQVQFHCCPAQMGCWMLLVFMFAGSPPFGKTRHVMDWVRDTLEKACPFGAVENSFIRRRKERPRSSRCIRSSRSGWCLDVRSGWCLNK